MKGTLRAFVKRKYKRPERFGFCRKTLTLLLVIVVFPGYVTTNTDNG